MSTHIPNITKFLGTKASKGTKVKKLFIWPAMKNMLFSLPKNIKNIIYGLVKKY